MQNSYTNIQDTCRDRNIVDCWDDLNNNEFRSKA